MYIYIMKRLNKEYSLNLSRTIDVKFGSVNKEEPKVVFLSGKCWVSPSFKADNYTNIIETIKLNFKQSIYSYLRSNECYSNKFILDFDINSEGMKEGVQKYLSFNVFFRQTQNPPYKLTDKKLSNEFYKIIDSFETELTENEFLVSKQK